jgi:hypothetical protein
LKSTPVIASALATFIMTAPTSSQANLAENLQVSSGQTELAFSQAAAEAIKTKAANSNLQTAGKTWTPAPNDDVFLEWRNEFHQTKVFQ